ncbi:MAG TPA: BON domain-containing protein [Terriglobales bacterium]|nr:BON domain-containing protein [Terriglobales bacterium]
MGRRNRQRTRQAAWLASGVLAGTALGWLTAPRRGDWVRNQVRQKLAHWRRLGQRTLSKRGRDVENRLRGSVAEVRQAWWGRGHYVDATTLVDQVQSQLGRAFSALRSHVNLNAIGHTVYLHGYVESEADRDCLVEAIRKVEGVGDVDAHALRMVPVHAAAGSRPRVEAREVAAGPAVDAVVPAAAPRAARPRRRRPAG